MFGFEICCKGSVKCRYHQIYRHFSKQENVFQAMIWPLIVVAPPVHSREGSYSYIKEIIDGNSIVGLSPEEDEALQKALNGED